MRLKVQFYSGVKIGTELYCNAAGLFPSNAMTGANGFNPKWRLTQQDFKGGRAHYGHSILYKYHSKWRKNDQTILVAVGLKQNLSNKMVEDVAKGNTS